MSENRKQSSEKERQRLLAEWAFHKAALRHLAEILDFEDPFPIRPYMTQIDVKPNTR